MSDRKFKTLERKPVWLAALTVLSLVATGVLPTVLWSQDDLEFTDVRSQTLQFIEWEKSIELTPEQEEIKRAALTALPAPCCSDNTAYTCCCPCNSAKAWWGLTAHLIAERGYDAEQVKEKVSEWFAFINPDGFSGDVCYTRGGCAKPFHENGCGGMDDKAVAFE